MFFLSGCTEPNPRDDLNDLYVAGKPTTLGRLPSLPIESAASFPVNNLIPIKLRSYDNSEGFISKLHEYDDCMETQNVPGRKAGMVYITLKASRWAQGI